MNTTTGIDLTPPHKTGFLGRGEIDSQSGILNFYSGVITDWLLISFVRQKHTNWRNLACKVHNTGR